MVYLDVIYGYFQTQLITQNKLNMKKFILTAMVATALFACGNKTETTDANSATASFPSNASGYTLDSSANTATLQKINELGWSGNEAQARTFYTDSAVVFDNGKKLTIDENMKMIPLFKSKGIAVKTEKYDAIWESVNNKANEDGIRNYVFAYENVAFTKGGKTVNVIVFQAVGFTKEGKIAKEWNVYDASALADFLK